MNHFLTLLPLSPTPDRLPLSRLRVRRPLVLHEEPTAITGQPAGNPFPLPGDVPCRRFLVVQDGESNRLTISPTPGFDRATVGAFTASITSPPRKDRAVLGMLNTVTESGRSPSVPASKAMVTFRGPWFTRHPANEEPAVLSIPTTVSSDGSQPITGGAYRLATGAKEVNPLPGAVSCPDGRGTCTPIMRPHGAGRLIVSMKPRKEITPMSQVESRTYRIANNISSIRREFMRLAVSDGMMSSQEERIHLSLQAIEDELEQKADDERAAIALIRTGRTKHTRGIVVDLFPSMGPEAA